MTTFILLAAMGPIREALARASGAWLAGHQVEIICFRRDIFDLVAPIQEDLVRRHLFEDQLGFSLKAFLQDTSALRDFKRRFSFLLTDQAEAYTYSTSISIAAICATVILSEKMPVYYEGVYEGRGASDGIFQFPCRKWTRRLRSLALSLLVRAPIEFCRDWSPVPVLGHSFATKRLQEAPEWQKSAVSSFERRLLRPIDAEIVILFTNYSDYFRLGDEPSNEKEIWSELGDFLKDLCEPHTVAVKPHPSYNRLPESWDWMEIIDPGFPLELLEFPNLRIVLGDASTAMIDLSVRRNIPVISYAYLYTGPLADKVGKYLDVRVDPHEKVMRPKTFSQFKQAVRTLFGEKVLPSDGRAV